MHMQKLTCAITEKGKLTLSKFWFHDEQEKQPGDLKVKKKQKFRFWQFPFTFHRQGKWYYNKEMNIWLKNFWQMIFAQTKFIKL